MSTDDDYDDGMTPEEFDRLEALGEPVGYIPGPKPIAVIKQVARILSSTFDARLASASSNAIATPSPAHVDYVQTSSNRVLVANGSTTA